MLFNPNWKTEPSPLSPAKLREKLLSIDTLIGWLETKPPDEEYNFRCCRGTCLLSRYLNEHGLTDHLDSSGPEYETQYKVWRELHRLYFDSIVRVVDANTFGRALERAYTVRHSLRPC